MTNSDLLAGSPSRPAFGLSSKTNPFDLNHNWRRLAVVLAVLVLVGLLPGGYFTKKALAAKESRVLQDYSVYSPVIYKRATYVPERVYVLANHSNYKDSDSGFLHIVGEVQNDTPYNVANVTIEATLFNKDNKALASESGSIYLDSLPPGWKTCFDVTFDDIPSGWSTYGFAAPAYTINSAPLPDVVVTSSAPSLEDNVYTIDGTARNYENERVYNVRPVGTLYNNSDDVIACGFTYLDGSIMYLNAGSSGSFTLTFYGRNYERVDSYDVQVGGYIP